MSENEMNNEFDILYDSIVSLGAPDLDKYEKSVFLTKAQLEIVKENLGPINKYSTSFEGSEKRRADLRELVKDYRVAPIPMTNGITPTSSYSAKLPEDLFLIMYESAFFTKEGCSTPQKIDIVPIKYDEYNERVKNPFRKPDNSNGFRLDVNSNNSGRTVELVITAPVDFYQIRYVKYPGPIILADLVGVSPNESLSVDGVNIKTECQLDEELHREIVDRAVQLAMLAYNSGSLTSKVQLDNRNN